MKRRFPKSEMRGLCAVVVILLVTALCVVWWQGTAERDVVPAMSDAERSALADFESQMAADTAAGPSWSASEPSSRGELFAFNPNTADASTLRRLGLTDRQISNLMKYRAAGGRWRSADDFSRLYGLSAAEFERLRPYVVIAPLDGEAVSRTGRGEAASRTDRQRDYVKVEKLPAGTKVNLATADTTLLKQIPGIGSWYARKICRYRESLGGFVSLAQLAEVEGLPEGLAEWFEPIREPKVRQLDINHATFSQLVRHPYLSYEQVKAVFDYRRKFGALKSLDELQLTGLFTASDLARLRPYVVFR